MASQSTPVTKQTKLAVFGAASLAFCGILVETSMNVTFPTLMIQFHQSLATVQWVTTAYLLAVAATMVIAAYTQQRFHWRTLINVGGGGFLLGGLLCAFAPNLLVLLLGRIIQAVGTGFALPLVFAQIMTQIPFNAQGRFTGTAGMLIALAPSLGPTYGGIVTQLLSWRLIFGITLPFGLMAWLVTVRNIRQTQPPVKQAFPMIEFALIVLALFLTILGINNVAGHGFSGRFVYFPLGLALIALIGFSYRATRRPHPLIHLQVFHQGTFTRALLVYFLIQLIQIGLTFLLPNFAQLALGQGIMLSGLMLLAGSLCSAVVSPFTGKLMDRVGIQIPARIGNGLLIGATLAMALLARHLTVGLIIILFAVFQVGFGFLFNNTLTFGLQQLPSNLIGDGNAVFNTLQQYSGSLGTAIMATLIAAGAQLAPHTTQAVQTTHGTQLALWFGVILIILASTLATTLKTPRHA